MRKTSLLALTPLLVVAAACGSQGKHDVAVISPAAHGQPAAQQGQQQQAQATSACTTGQLALSLGRSDGAAGSVYTPLVFTNKSETTCTLFGYPGVSFVAPGNGKQVGAAATRNPQHPSRTVTLAPGHSASSVVQIANYQNYPASTCAKTKVSGLRVYPPGNKAAAYVKFSSNRTACSSNVHQLSIESLVKGKTGM